MKLFVTSKNVARAVIPRVLLDYRRKVAAAPIISEIRKLDIQEFGVQREESLDLNYMRLANGTILYVQSAPNDFSELYSVIQKHLYPRLTSEAFAQAIRVLMSYVYPVALPACTAPYPRKARRNCFGQYAWDTIEDLPGMNAVEKRNLKEVFAPRQGTLFLDCGAWMGYGSLKVRQSVPGAKVVAFEADKTNFQIARKNFAANDCSDVTLLQTALWSSRNQMNYLERGHVRRGSASVLAAAEKGAEEQVKRFRGEFRTVAVETETIDAVVGETARNHDHICISLTVNGGELDVIRGMAGLLSSARSVSLATLSSASHTYATMKPLLESYGLRVIKGRGIRVLAWK